MGRCRCSWWRSSLCSGFHTLRSARSVALPSPRRPSCCPRARGWLAPYTALSFSQRAIVAASPSARRAFDKSNELLSSGRTGRLHPRQMREARRPAGRGLAAPRCGMNPRGLNLALAGVPYSLLIQANFLQFIGSQCWQKWAAQCADKC